MAGWRRKETTAYLKKKGSVRDVNRRGNQVAPEGAEYQHSEEHLPKERSQARDMRRSQWWRRQLAKGRCYYCRGVFLPNQLTMDHILPISLGGRSERGNIVPCCVSCNTEKKNKLPWRWQSRNNHDGDKL